MAHLAARHGPVLLLALLAASRAGAMTDPELHAVRDGFEARRDAAVEALRGQPYRPAKKQPPLGPGRAAYTRAFSYAALSFAFRALWLDEQPDAARAALDENSRYYLEHPESFADRDSFYWGADLLCRIVELFGRDGRWAPGRLGDASEDLILELMHAYAKDYSKLADAEVEQSRTWHVWESENHHIQKFSALWQFSRLLARAPAWRDRPYADGRLPAAHDAAWTAYARAWCRERARRGLFVEMANGNYGVHTLKGLYNFHDFADDPTLRRLAGQLLDLYWACWAEEQLDGVRGGGQSRVYPANGLRGRDELYAFSRYYLGDRDLATPANHLFTLLSSGYRLPLVVMDLALDPAGRGEYAIRQRKLGAVEPGFFGPPDYRLNPDHGGLARYTWCTPDFIMGLPLLGAEPLEHWAMISSQNRWLGVLFAGHPDARIVPLAQAPETRAAYNTLWGVQSRGSQLVQRLPAALGKGSAGLRIFFSAAGFGQRVEADGWAFVEAAGAWAAVRPARGGYRWEPRPEGGDWMIFDDGDAPAILEVARRAEFADFATFRAAVAARPITWSGPRLTWHGLGPDTLTLPTDATSLPEINGQPIDLEPTLAYDSPFVQGRWGANEITIAKDGRRVVLEFGG